MSPSPTSMRHHILHTVLRLLINLPTLTAVLMNGGRKPELLIARRGCHSPTVRVRDGSCIVKYRVHGANFWPFPFCTRGGARGKQWMRDARLGPSSTGEGWEGPGWIVAAAALCRWCGDAGAVVRVSPCASSPGIHHSAEGQQSAAVDDLQAIASPA